MILSKNHFYRGDYSIINTGVLIEHECTIGEYVHIAINATICGGCVISNDVFVGANATIIQGVNVGENSMIGAGSIVLKDVPPNTTVVGIWEGYRLNFDIGLTGKFYSLPERRAVA